MSQKGINNMPDHTVNIGDAERTTQDRVVAFLKQLGYRYLGNEQDNQIDHSCLDSNHLKDWLKKQHRYNEQILRLFSY